MAKAFKKSAPAPAPVEEVEVEEVETEEAEEETPLEKSKKLLQETTEEVEVDGDEDKPKKGKKTVESGEKPKGAPRARKWNYGNSAIAKDSTAKILLVKDATAPKGVADQAAYVKNGMTVAAFYEAGGDRHGLRVMMRNSFIVVKDGDEQYPQAYDHAAAAAEREAKAKARAEAKAAKEAAEAEEQEEEEAPAPAKKPAAKK